MRERNVLIMLIVACVVPHAIKLAYYPDYPGFDDAFIHLRVAENVSQGKGWGVNAFEPMNVSSSPLFTLVLAAAQGLGLRGALFGMIFSAVATSAAIAVAHVVATRLMPSRVAVVPALLFGVNLHLWRWNATVMEPTLACLLLGCALWAFLWAMRGGVERFALFGFIVGLAFLTRFELGLLLPAGALARAGSARAGDRPFRSFTQCAFSVLLGFVPIAAAWAAFCWYTFGTILPTTYLSKASSMSFANVATWRSILIVLVTSLGIPALVATVSVYRAARVGSAAVRALIEPFLPALSFALLCLAFYAVSMPSFQSPARYLLPTVYALGIAVVGIAVVGFDRFGMRIASPRIVLALGVIHVIAMLAIHHVSVAPVLAAFRDNYWRASRMAAEYLVEVAEPGESVFAVSDIGMLAYYSHDRYRVVDGPGLADPSLARLNLPDALRRSHARLVVEHYGMAGATLLDLVPDLPYKRERAFPFVAPGLVSAGSDFTLNVYSTPALEPR